MHLWTPQAPQRPRQADGYRTSAHFRWPERVPFSELGEDFIRAWGRNAEGRIEPQHVEITGQNGSGKTHALIKFLQDRVRYRGSSSILIATKKQDSIFDKLGWPIGDTYQHVQDNRWSMFWPQTGKQAGEREAYHEEKLWDLLTRMWHENANTVIAVDEIGYVEELSRRLKKLIRQYWREARSLGITFVAMKQRPVGVSRDQHSESKIKAVFPPADMADMDRFAELLGHPRDWAPVLDSLDQEAHEFVLRNNVTRHAYITWIDEPLRAIAAQATPPRPAPRERLYGRRGGVP
jgi:nucleoside-triphosphatase THEP1